MQYRTYAFYVFELSFPCLPVYLLIFYKKIPKQMFGMKRYSATGNKR